MHRYVELWKRVTESGGYRYVVRIVLNLTLQSLEFSSFIVGPRGGTQEGGAFALTVDEWNEVTNKMQEALAEDIKNDLELKARADAGDPTAIAWMERE